MTRTWYIRFLIVLASGIAGLVTLWPTFHQLWPGVVPLPEAVAQNITAHINPGLDIRGGLRLSYEVDIEEAIRDRRETRADQVIERLCAKLEICEGDERPTREQIAETREQVTLFEVGDHSFRIQFTDPADLPLLDRDLLRSVGEVREVERTENSALISLTQESMDQLSEVSVSQARETISRRIDELGLREASVITRETDVIVEVPGSDETDFDTIRSIIARTARLEFKVVDDRGELVGQLDDVPDGITIERERVSAGTENPNVISSYLLASGEGSRARLEEYIRQLEAGGRIPDDHQLAIGREQLSEEAAEELGTREAWRTYYLFDRAEVTGEAIQDASVSVDPEDNRPFVSIRFTTRGTQEFGRLTEANVRRRMAIVLDNVVSSAPVIETAIRGGNARITMGGIQEYNEILNEANELVIVLRAGALPAPIHASNEQLIGPTLGADAVQQGAFGALLGIALVLLYMLIYYEVAGLVADLMVMLNVVLLLAALAALGASLTLPGIAGIALTVGMAVDANVLINERMREELRAGKSARQAVERGFDMAFSSIIDSQLTTLFAGIVLFQYGTGPIKGFAVTLMLGIVTSIFTGVFCSRVMFEWLVNGLKITKLRVG